MEKSRVALLSRKMIQLMINPSFPKFRWRCRKRYSRHWTVNPKSNVYLLQFFQSPGRSYPYSNKTRQRNVNSFIISASVKGLVINNLTEPVETAYYPLQRGNNKNAECVFWDFRLKNGQGDWSGEDCYYKGTINGLVNCHCNHLTNFAILLVRLKIYKL